MKRKILKTKKLIKYYVQLNCGHFAYSLGIKKAGQMFDCKACLMEDEFKRPATAWRWKPYEVR